MPQDYDCIVVMAEGTVAEMGSPGELLRAGGIFAGMVGAGGDAASQRLRRLIEQADADANGAN